MRTLPSGTVTLLFTDIEGSTRLLHELGDRYVEVLGDHRRVLRAAVAEHHGVEVDTQGDAFFIAFANAPDAVAAARAAQLSLAKSPVRVRMGIHTGTPAVTPEGYVGVDVHRGARICAAGHGGQILISKTTRDSLAEVIELRDLGEHRLKDLQRPEWLFQVIALDLEPRFPPLRSLSNTNLPAEASKFIGRQRELAEMSEVLGREEVRLLTLTGAGGSGKTRLSIRLAAEFVEHFKNGVFLVSLAPVSDPARVLGAIAQTLGAKEEATEAPADTLRRHLEGKQVLLVLDNFEHLLAAASDVSLLLASAPQLKVIVTSRERLRLAGEHEFVVPPLPEDDAVTLFDVRARAAKPSFRVELDRAPVLAICRRLDGLPLAVELAAARVKVLGPQALLARLEQRLPVLTGGPRDMPDRQRTLRATIQWSYLLLDEHEQEVLARLSVFVGGCDVSAAEQVCGASFDDLVSLFDKSLIQKDDRTGGEARFTMLETIREFASARLVESGEAERIREALCSFVVKFAQTFREGKGHLAAVELEHANIRSVVAGARAGPEAAVARRVVAALQTAWCQGEHSIETEGWVREAVQNCDDDPPEVRAQLLEAAGAYASVRGNRLEAITRFEEAVLAWRSLDDPHLGTCLSMLANELAGATRHEDAIRVGDDAVAWARTRGNIRALIDALVNRGEVARLTGDDALALRLDEEALPLAREAHLEDIAVLLANIAQLHLRCGDTERARGLLHEAIDGAVAIRQPAILAYVVATAAGVSIADQLPQQGVRLLASAQAASISLHITMMETDRLEFDRNLEIARRGLSALAFDSAWAKGSALSLEQAAVEALALCAPRT